MNTKQAIRTIESREGNPYEWDHDLMDAAECLAEHVTATPSFELYTASSAAMKAMNEGDTLIFSAGERTSSGILQGATAISCIASRSKMKVTQRTVILTDPTTFSSSAAILVKCIVPYVRRKKPLKAK